MPDEPLAPNRLDAALNRLEEVVKTRIEQPMKHLRHVINWRRGQGGFDEDQIAVEIEKIAFRDLGQELRRGLSVGDEIESLAARLMKEAP